MYPDINFRKNYKTKCFFHVLCSLHVTVSVKKLIKLGKHVKSKETNFNQIIYRHLLTLNLNCKNVSGNITEAVLHTYFAVLLYCKVNFLIFSNNNGRIYNLVNRWNGFRMDSYREHSESPVCVSYHICRLTYNFYQWLRTSQAKS